MRKFSILCCEPGLREGFAAISQSVQTSSRLLFFFFSHARRIWIFVLHTETEAPDSRSNRRVLHFEGAGIALLYRLLLSVFSSSLSHLGYVSPLVFSVSPERFNNNIGFVRTGEPGLETL